MKKAMNKTLVAAAVAGLLGLASSSVFAQTTLTSTNFPDFRVNEVSVAGAAQGSFTADKITGN